ncbi:MAG: DUF2283 domain-containing protein [Candidatus Schekmanbacteria bacterium]|nr:DUF2283 domain-containing protein [Candidatus Schekmanbacteria bacterium]
MKVIYDPATDTLSLILRDEPITESDEVEDGIILDYDRNGKVVSIEMLDASQNVSEPLGISYELKAMEKAA